MDAQTIVAQLETEAAAPKARHRYTYEQNIITRQEFYKAGAVDTIIAVGGFRLVMTHLDSTLVSILPKARTAGRGHYVLWTGGPRDYGRMDTMGGFHYDSDPCGPMRLAEALLIAFSAWETAGGNVDKLYKAIGSRGFCAMCGATLTDPLSCDRGIGPECIKKVYKRPAIKHLQTRNMARS